MKILIVTDIFPVVSQTFVDLHVETLLDRGHDLRILARAGNTGTTGNVAQIGLMRRLTPVPSASGPRWSRIGKILRTAPIDLRSVPLGAYFLMDYISGRSFGGALSVFSYAAALCQDENWDIVHVHFGHVALSLAQLVSAGFIRAPMVVTFHGSDLNFRKSISNSQFYKRVFRTADMFTVGTRFMSERLLECNVSPEKVRVIPMGIALSRFPFEHPASHRKTGNRLVTVGRLVELKGTRYLIRAVAELKSRFPQISLDVIGDGPLQGELNDLVRRLELTGHVTFHGALMHADVIRVMNEADIYVHPGCIAADGTQEGQGLALAEASALGLPVVASRVGGVPEMIEESQTGFLVEPTNVVELTERIGSLVANAELRDRMGASGRAFVETHLDQRRLIDTWLSLYQSLIA